MPEHRPDLVDMPRDRRRLLPCAIRAGIPMLSPTKSNPGIAGRISMVRREQPIGAIRKPSEYFVDRFRAREPQQQVTGAGIRAGLQYPGIRSQRRHKLAAQVRPAMQAFDCDTHPPGHRRADPQRMGPR